MTSYLLLEDNNRVLLESGSVLLTEGTSAVVVGTAQFASRRLRRRFDSEGPRRAP